jgi:hypothetical protein
MGGIGYVIMETIGNVCDMTTWNKTGSFEMVGVEGKKLSVPDRVLRKACWDADFCCSVPVQDMLGR